MVKLVVFTIKEPKKHRINGAFWYWSVALTI